MYNLQLSRWLKINKIFLGYLPCQLVKNQQRFRDYLWSLHDNVDEDRIVLNTSMIFKQLTRLIAGADIINKKIK
jgi:hypothetical protein